MVIANKLLELKFTDDEIWRKMSQVEASLYKHQYVPSENYSVRLSIK